MKLTIKITKEVLEKSKTCGLDGEYKSKGCAIALACIDLFGNDARVGHAIYVSAKGGRAGIPLPHVALSFIALFDSLNPELRVALPEFSFVVEVPANVIESIGIGQVYKILSESSTLELCEL